MACATFQTRHDGGCYSEEVRASTLKPMISMMVMTMAMMTVVTMTVTATIVVQCMMMLLQVTPLFIIIFIPCSALSLSASV